MPLLFSHQLPLAHRRRSGGSATQVQRTKRGKLTENDLGGSRDMKNRAHDAFG